MSYEHVKPTDELCPTHLAAGAHFDSGYGRWECNVCDFPLVERGSVEDRCNKASGYHSTPHRGCIMR